MKNIKKYILGIILIGLTIALAACGNENKNEGNYTVSDVLNAKKTVPIIVTDSKDESEDDHVVWAGFIGQGKVKAMFLDGTNYDFGYKDLKKLSDEKYNESLIDMGKDYEPNPFKYVTAKSKTVLKPNWKSEDNDEDKAEAVTLKFTKKGNDSRYGGVRDAMNNAVYSKVVEKEDDDKWATIKSEQSDSDTSGYEMHIKLGEGKENNLKLEDVKETKKKYNNIEVDNNSYN